MEYKCFTTSLSKLPVGPRGVSHFLCDICKSQDCSNSIEQCSISVFGLVEKHKAFVRGQQLYAVTGCEGFVE